MSTGRQSTCPDEARLRDLAAGMLTADQEEPLRLHLDTCAVCQDLLESLTIAEQPLPATTPVADSEEPACAAAIERLLRFDADAHGSPESTGGIPPDDDLVLDFLAQSTRPGYIGRLDHYEIIEVIGRGGMGIVLR